MAFTTLPVPSNPITAGKGTTAYPPESLPLSEGLTVEASTLTKSWPSVGSGIGSSSNLGSFPY